jgi:hypothetical protein
VCFCLLGGIEILALMALCVCFEDGGWTGGGVVVLGKEESEKMWVA